MIDQLARRWWLLALRGVIAILFSLAAFFWPGMTLTLLIIFFAAYALVDGVFTLAAAFTSRKNGRWWMLLLEGLVGITVGVLAFIWPGLTALALLYLIAAWAVATGILEIIAAIRLRKHITGEWLLALTGMVSIALGVLLIMLPAAGLLALVWVIGAYALLFGLLLLALAWRLRALRQSPAIPAHASR